MSSIRDKSSSHNSNYQQDIRYVFKLNHWIMGSLGIWPIPIRGIGRHMSKIAIAIFNFALSFAIVPCTLHIIYDQKDLDVRLRLSGLLAFCVTVMTKYCIFVIHRPKIYRCIEYVKNDWWQVTFKSDRELMLKYATTGRNLTIIGVCFMYTAGIIYHLILPFCVEHKIDNQTIRPLVYPIYTGACGLAALFVTHACGQIQVIMSRLENLLNDENSNIHQQIAIIVKDHVRIDWKHDNKISLATYFLLFISFCFNVYILCYIGELLMEKSIEIGSMCYMINWYQLSPRSVRSLILIIAMSSHPIKLTAGRMANLSLTTFGNSTQIGSICYMINWYQLSPISARSLILIIAMSSHPIKLTAGRMIDLSLKSFRSVLQTSLAYLSFLRTLVI
ncbi:PREDICTED: odorant receptor 13a-like [Atta cephalotes]|uniref:Odorant receptor n=1 Tax=Atta cephalotes TaxID=12957 RepID=A0A158P0A7_ATTCE|nr:PREDICTED: odorant receptor 13a-like [Atta cephalotes]